MKYANTTVSVDDADVIFNSKRTKMVSY